MMRTAIDMLTKESSFLCKAFELSNIRIQACIHPVQQFASTFDHKIDVRNHLDIVNKVPSIQKFLTQIRNRSLEVQTITSGKGIIISSKDLRDCLEECCRSLVKHSEIEMRTRCEHLSLMVDT
jgi:hypothetical protein